MIKKNTVNTIRIAVYMRLSKAAGETACEDEEIQTENGSISMQRILLRKYIREHFDSYQILEYQDDGFSGTNFNRPGVQNLLEDAKNEKFDCIVVKDFSRFGRDYIELGSYLEQIFPFLGIRFISVNDHYDSADCQGHTSDLDVNFKNLLYDMYSKDLSRKIKTALHARKESGKFVSGSEPFGYEKSLEDRHMLVILEEEAEIVRRIFDFRLRGLTSTQIARQLNLENVPTPVEFKIRKGKTSRKPKGDKFYWSNSVICSILRNPVYAGDIAYGKTEREQVGGPNVLKEKKDWKIIRNHHAPIITREEFEEVRKSMGKSRKQRETKKKHPLIGKVVCGCCKHNLRLREERRNPYFTCYHRYETGLDDCVRGVNAMFLEQVVLYRLQEYMDAMPLESGSEEVVSEGKEALVLDMAERYIEEVVVYGEENIEIKWKKPK
ncbi:MAG: recombinase family protein [Lachnospiraceae bacterium]|nr:recombinase family protein [Lachnospiraceae bacterium]